MTTKTLRKVFMMVALSGGLMSTGCDMIDKLKGAKKDDDSSSSKKKKSSDDDDDDDDSKKPSSSATASAAPTADASAAPTASAATPPPAADDVTRYPDETPQSGTFVTKKNFTIYQAADTTSKEIGHIGAGTIIELKASHQAWMLINWPSGVGELSLGWVQVRVHDTTIAVTNDPIKVIDAGVPVVDAGRPIGVIDAGRGRIPVVRVPVPTHR